MQDIKCKNCNKLLGKATIMVAAIKCPRCKTIFEYHVYTNTLHVTYDDLLAFEHTSTGTPANSSMKWAYVFSAPAITSPVTGYYRLPIVGVG